MENNKQLLVTASPHIRSKRTVANDMLDVIIALIPAGAVSVYYFGYRALVLILASVITCVLAETIFNKCTKRPNSVKDLSAVVTGILLAYNVPFTLPVWQLVIGSVFAIVICKMLYGGIGQNIVNPALGARAFLMASWSSTMTNFVPTERVATLKTVSDVSMLTAATPLSDPKSYTIMDLFIGHIPGCLGEISALALLIGALYLLVRKVIHIRIPLVYILTTTVILAIFGDKVNLEYILKNILSGGLILGAFYMATDYTTAPITPKGQIVFGFGCGLITAVIRLWGGYPEGVSYSILLMNLLVPVIEKHTRDRIFGKAKAKKGGKNEQ
ncbi:RnfABCDGE type electron transport complex subunit D [Anaerococcus lactolyticus]|uniref:Ion-translocating oxidoreductase complex subunit D n=2 Tax=Anaerococcus lactolyticus TaxID=33032 RepID=C2BCE9_9FIRM|nr:RnfABCDGE type electron transport complex subunit D [Anaerococcus lactolyticus]EEI87351.1 electron transport complex, RnfABCDGE type, D subunit [Anaerococcus lactolyticus ATCC 51172]KGF03576.1 NADH:ubiquinone oxidoreductase [Anaerococcus lactolyticus S7-1-13]